MGTEAHIEDLALLQVSDSFFPAGLYATSSGLETLVARGDVSGREALEEIVRLQISQQVGPSDCVAAIEAHRLAGAGGAEAVRETDMMAMALKPVREAREASARSGAQTLRAAREMSDAAVLGRYAEMVRLAETPGSYPVALGVSCLALGIGAPRAALSLLYGFSVSVIGAALRLGIIDHLEGQRTLGALRPDIARAVERASAMRTVDMWQFTPHLDICQMDHERVDTRMFAT